MSNILIVGPSWIGDMVMAQSLFIFLKSHNPGCVIDVVAPEWSIPLIERMPEVNEAISLPVKHKELAILKRFRIGKLLRSKKYQSAIIIPRSYKSALIPFFANIPKRIGYRGEMRYGVLNDIRPLDKSILKKTVERYVNLGRNKNVTGIPEIPTPKLSINAKNRELILEKLNLEIEKPVIGLMIGAEYGSAKQWPYYRELALLLSGKGYNIWLFGSEKDMSVGDKIKHNNDNIINLCGKTELVDVVDLITVCDKIVSNDSGLMHVAAAVNKPLIAIYGSSTPNYTPPLSSEAKIHYLNLDCSPCFKRECPLGHTNCLKNISADDVFNSVLGKNK